jgi:transposase InsO family protein
VSRAGYFRRLRAAAPREHDMELRDRIQRIVLAHRRYGYRRVTAQLRREGLAVNRKKVLRLMRADNLLALQSKRYVLTTDSNHNIPVYPNLLPHLKLDGLDQIWQSDITYIRLRERFVYLAVVLDAFSRRVVGWRLGPTLEAELAVGALRQALEARRPAPGLVHHSDQGVQYASRAYVELLEGRGAVISMSRRGNPYDNAKAESFMRTLKSEEVDLRQYRDLADAEASIGEFLVEVYNRRRLHSALGYLPPAEFEALQPAAPTAARNPKYEFSKA